MTDLRWVLLALGILVIVAVYLFSLGIPQRWLSPIVELRRRKAAESVRVEPAFDEPDQPEEDDTDTAERSEAAPAPAETIVTLRFIPNSKTIASDKVVLALRAEGLKHGRYGVFHKHANDSSDEPMFSVASLTEPGSFDLSRLAETKIPGMSFFMVLPGEGDPVERFDSMVAVARSLARELGGELRDDKGSSWSIQRERYIREEIIEYCHLLAKPQPYG
ncbi:MAG TPA: cell division protein ZipA C-terminal FtsZ-binding domain-containing protein [Gammaproteobacteria bacterium]|nr:cell division protein ZipA C-terminal FtsZ-binding domain-containing protein [Gammaproteobacteria bacterium]